jgi:hypothetical protein
MFPFVAAIKSHVHRSKGHLKDVIRESGGPATLFDFRLDRTCVRPASLKKYGKTNKYIPLAQLSQGCSARSHFTTGCVCEILGDAMLLSDLHSIKRILRARDRPVLNKFDVIAIEDPKTSPELAIDRPEQIVCIGSCGNVTKCTHSGDDDVCCVYIDSRNGPVCDTHWDQLYKNAQRARMLGPADSSPGSSPARPTVRQPLAEVPIRFINQYLENQPHGRAAKMMRATSVGEAPKIGSGFAPGDDIPLVRGNA